MRPYVHIIDPDFRRRARISRDLMRRNLHAEIYDGIDEFRSRIPSEGSVFTVDDPQLCRPREVIEMIEGTGQPLPVACYSDDPSPERIVQAMLDGALDYLQLPFDPELLDNAVRRLLTEGERRAEQYRRRTQAKTLIEGLSLREMQVLALMAQGNSNKDIAFELNISPRTVEIHRGNMMRKLNARSTSDAIRLAVYAGLDETSDVHLLAA